MHCLQILLLNRLHRHEAHARPAHRLADRLGVVRIRLVCLHVRLHELRGDQLHPEAFHLQHARPVMRAAARFHADLAARLDITLEIPNPAASLQPLAPRRPLCAIDAMHLEDLLRQIHTHARKLHDDLSPFRDW